MMKSRLLLGLLLLSGLWTGALAQVQYSTDHPRVEEVNDKSVTITRVDLTDQYTVIYITYVGTQSTQRRERGRIQLPDIFRFPDAEKQKRPQPKGDYEINFIETARLYVNQGEKSFKFIRAENIPVERSSSGKNNREVSAGERVDFVAYFERITPGYEVFDLFECSDRRRGETNTTCFNFWGVHITNPARRNRQPDPQTRRTIPPATQPTRPAPAPVPAQPEPAPQPVPAPMSALVVKGIVRDAKTQKPVVATITYRLLSGAETSGDSPGDSTLSGRLAGNYQFVAEPLSVYAVSVKAKGYFGQSDTLTVTRAEKVRDFDLMPIEAGAKITLKNIYFNVSKFDLKPESYPELDRLAQVMRENPDMSIRLEGHTDIVGEFDANVELSRNRVNEVKRYLVGKGIRTDRVETIGYGPSRPINTNKSLKERPENRRVEMVVTRN